MVSPILSIEPWKVVEKQDERQSYVQYKDEKFVKVLFEVAKKVLDAPVTTTQSKRQYIDTIEDINAHYFAAQDMNTATKGQFHRYDATAEDNLRESVAIGVSRCVADIRTLCTAHSTVIETANAQLAQQHDDPRILQDVSITFEQTIATCTIRAICDGWFPMFESYYFSLNPGERAAEGRERQEQRLFGTEATQGVVDRLAQPEFKQLTAQDLRHLEQINTESQVNGHSVLHKLKTKYDWAVSS